MARTAKPWFDRQKNCWTVWMGGRRHRLAEGRQNRKAAHDRYKQLLFEASKNPPRESRVQTVASVIEQYLKLEVRNVAPSTYENKKFYLQLFAEEHGFREVAACGRIDLQTFIADHPEWESDWTISAAVNIVQRAFNWAADGGVIPVNPFKGYRHRTGEPRRPLTKEEFRAILRVTSTREQRKPPAKPRPSDRKRHLPTPGARFRQILYFLWYTGCRPAEASKLRWSNVDFYRGLIVLHEHKTKRLQRQPKPRVIPMIPVLVRLLRSIQARKEGEYVFLNHRRHPWNKNSLSLRMKRARKKAGVPDDAKLYGTRHAFGTRGIIDGQLDVKTLAELMGHTSTRMTEHYLHLAGQHAHLAAAMQRVNAPRRDA